VALCRGTGEGQFVRRKLKGQRGPEHKARRPWALFSERVSEHDLLMHASDRGKGKEVVFPGVTLTTAGKEEGGVSVDIGMRGTSWKKGSCSRQKVQLIGERRARVGHDSEKNIPDESNSVKNGGAIET